MRRSLNVNTMYLNKWNNSSVPVFASSYLLDIVFPSRSRSVPYKLRRYLRDFFIAYNSFIYYKFEHNQFEQKMLLLWNKFKDLCFLPRDFKADLTYTWLELSQQLTDLFDKIRPYLDIDFDIDLINSLDSKRCLFLSKLASTAPEVDIRAKAYVVKKRFSRSRAVETL